ncbi:unnamed protein product [Closterium sp. NIES-65]|nr:unnamed protein product [Closterium sp. NIES-65]
MDAAMSPVAGTPEAASPRAADGSAVPPLASLAKPSSSGDLSSLGDANSDIPWWSVALPLDSSGGAASPLFSPLLSPLPGNSGLGGEGFALYGDLGRLDGEWDSPEGRRQSDVSVAGAADDDAGDAAAADVTQGARGGGAVGVGAAAGEGWGDEALSSRGSDDHVAAASAARGTSDAGVARSSSSSAWDACDGDMSSSGAAAGRGVGADVRSPASGGEGRAEGRAEEHAEAACPHPAETRQAEGAAAEAVQAGSVQPAVIEAVQEGSGASGGEREQVGGEASGEAGAAGLQRRYPSFRVRGHAPDSSAQDRELVQAPALPAAGADARPGVMVGQKGVMVGQKGVMVGQKGVLQLWSPGSSPSDVSPSALAASAAVAAAAEAAVRAADTGSASGDAMDSAGAWRPTAHVDGSPLPAGALSVAAAAETRPKRRHPKAPAAAAVAAAAGGPSAASPRGAWRSAEARSSRRRRRAQQRRAGARGASGSSGESDDDFWGVGQSEGRAEGQTEADGVHGAVGGLPTGVVAPCESSAAAAAAGAGAGAGGGGVDTGSDGRGSAGAAVEAASGMAECSSVELRQGGSSDATAGRLAADGAAVPCDESQQPARSAARTPSRFASLRQRWEHGGAAADGGAADSDGDGDGNARDSQGHGTPRQQQAQGEGEREGEGGGGGGGGKQRAGGVGGEWQRQQGAGLGAGVGARGAAGGGGWVGRGAAEGSAPGGQARAGGGGGGRVAELRARLAGGAWGQGAGAARGAGGWAGDAVARAAAAGDGDGQANGERGGARAGGGSNVVVLTCPQVGRQQRQQGDEAAGGAGGSDNGDGGGSGGHAGGAAAECTVHLIGTAHVSKESCNEVRRIIRQVKPDVVFLEVCSDRVAMLMPMDHLQLPSLAELMAVWRSNKSNSFALLYGYLLAKVAARMEVCPGAEFRAAYEEAVACGAVVKLGDRPVQVTLRRTWAMMSRWHRVKLVAMLLLQALWLPSKAELDHLVEELKSSDLLSLAVAEMGRAFPSLLHTLIHERDLYMACMLRHVAKRSSRVVAVVGKGHVAGITAHWTRTDIDVAALLRMPAPPTPLFSPLAWRCLLASMAVGGVGVAALTIAAWRRR